MSDIEDPADAPLDPATERLRRKMVRLLGVSIGVMLVGVMAVLIAVVYRASETEAVLEEGASVPIALPTAGEIVETALDGDRFLIRVAAPGGEMELFVVDRNSGAILSRHPLTQR